MENIITQTQRINTTFLLRRGLISKWEEKNPILEYGEPGVGYEVDENENIISYVFKIGDGIKTWTELAAVASDKEIQLSYDNFEYEINNLVNAYIVLGPPQEDGTRLPAAGMLYSAYGLGDTPGSIDEYDVKDLLLVEGKSAYAVGRNIRITDDPTAAQPDEKVCNYASAFGAHHNISGYGSFTAGVNNDVSSKAKYGVTSGNYLYNNGSRAVAFGEGTNRLTKILSDKNMTIADIANLSAEDFAALLRPERTSVAWGDYSFISGRDNIAYGQSSVAIGEWLFAGGEYATVFGHANKVFGNKSAAFGDYNIVKANDAFVVGSQNAVENYPDGNGYSTTIGLLNNVKGKYTFTTGWKNQNNGSGSVALGWANRISGQASVVTGQENIINTGYAFAAGTKSYANHYGSSVLGMGLKSTGANSTIVGQFNKPKSSVLFAVGNGSGAASDLTITDSDTFDETDNVKRSNALEVYVDGHAEVGVMGNTDNTIVTKKYTDDNSAELKRYVEAQTTVEEPFTVNDNIIRLENLDPNGTAINSKINYIASQNDIFKNGTFETKTIPTEWAQIIDRISDDPWDTHSADGINKVGRIGAIDATSTHYVKYYKGKMNIEVGRTYILEMKIDGKIGIRLESSQGIGEGNGWTVFESPKETWKTVKKQFTCVGRADGSAENVGWTMGFGLPKGETTNGAFIDDVKIYPLCEVKFQEEESSDQTIYFADPDNGSLPTFETTANSVTIYTFDNSDSLGIDPVISGSYTKNIKSTLENLETQLATINAADIAYNGKEQYIHGSTVEEALNNASHKILQNSMDIENKADFEHRQRAGTIDYSHAIEDNEYGQSQYVLSVSEALDYLFDKQESGGSSGATDAADITYDGSEQFIGGTTVQEALDSASNAIISVQSSIPDARTIVSHINNSNTDHINSNRISYRRTNSADVYTATTAFDYLFENINNSSSGVATDAASVVAYINSGASDYIKSDRILYVAPDTGELYTVTDLFENINNSSSGVATNAADITYNGSTQYIGGTNVEEALNNASHKILQNSMDIENKADFEHRQGAGTIDYSHAIEDNEYGQSQHVLSVSEALDYLFDKQESGGSSGATDASQIVYNDAPLTIHLEKLDYDLTHLTAYNVAYHYSFEEGKGVHFTHVNGALDWLCNQYKNLDTALDRIIAIQENLIGGKS